MMITLFLEKKYVTKLFGNATNNVVYLVRLKKAQDQGLHFWQTKTFAIITHATVPGDCIDRVTVQNGDRVILERLATPRPAPKVTLKSNWLTQQQQEQRPQQLTLEEGVNSSWKQHATWDSNAGVRYDTKNATEAEIASRKQVRAVSKVEVGTHLSVADVFANNEANTQEIERAKIGSNKICFREDPAVPFSKWATWSSLSRRIHRNNAYQACAKFLREHVSENAAHISDCHKR